ncbi:MAG: hypothetical protein HQ509_02335 [Candidatus Marinimicrobia bacterium]|nr:hypothetical protein [Candidatus Neomarinimicrobiota bacterium]
MKSTLILILSFLFLFAACEQKQANSSPVVARVNGVSLTVDEYIVLRQQYADQSLSRDHIVSQWIQSELLYQAALEKDFHKDKTLLSSIEEYRRKLLGDIFLESLIKKSTPLSNADIKSYYESNKASFVRLVDEARIYHFMANTTGEARNIVRALKRKSSGGELKSLFIDYNVNADIVKKGFLMPELDELIFSSSGNVSVLGPKKINDQYHVVEILDHYSAGSVISLDEAYDEIYQRLIQKKIIFSSKIVLDSLYNHNNIETHLENINE